MAVANSFTEFVPGHVHLREVGQVVAAAVKQAGAVPREFNTIAVDDGIAMGHGGMLYSLPSRELIADSVEYMVNAHCADALVCVSNCDKITPGMLMAALRLNIPTVFVSGGPMEAGRIRPGEVTESGDPEKLDLINPMIAAADPSVSDEQLALMEENACPTCGSCSGMFTANSMNCLTEAMGLALPGNGTTLATHTARRELFEKAGALTVELARRYYQDGDESVLPRSIATRDAFENAMALDVAMGGSTNTILHLLAAAHEARVGFGLKEIDELSRRVPCLCKVAPSSDRYHVEDVHRAGGIAAILAELDRAGLLNQQVHTVHSGSLREFLDTWDLRSPSASDEAQELFHAAPGGVRTTRPFSQASRWTSLDLDREAGCIRDQPHAYTQDGGLAVLYGNLAPEGADRQDGRRARGAVAVLRPGQGVREPGGRGRGHPGRPGRGRRRGGDQVRGTERRAGHAGDAVPDQLPQGQRPGPGLRADHRRPVLRRHVGAVHLPRRPGGGGRRGDRAGPGRRPGRDRHPGPLAGAQGRGRRPARPAGSDPGRAGQLPGRGPGPPGQRGAAGLRGAGHLGLDRRGPGHQQARTVVAAVRDWVGGARPRTLPAAVVPVVVGSGVAFGYGHFSLWRGVLALIVALALQVGVNYANDYSDGVRGTDERRVGPVRLVAAGIAAPRHVKSAALACFAVACLAGAALAAVTSWWLILLGAAAVAAAWTYTGGKHPYGYHGFGEIAVFAFFGLAAVAGTTYVEMHSLPWLGVVAALPVGLLACALLVINNLRDIPSDTVAGKRTLAVLLGDARTRALYTGCALVPFAIAVAMVAARPLALITLLTLPLAVIPVRAVRSGAAGPALIGALGATGRLQLAFGILLSVGLAVRF